MPLVEWAALLPFPSHVLTYGSGSHAWLGGPTVLIKSRLAALFVIIRLLLSLIILFIALNPRSQSALHGDRVSTATSSLLNLLEILLPSLDLYSIKPRWIYWLLRWKVLHKVFTSFSPNRGFSWTQLRGFKTAIWLTTFSYISWRVATTLACALFETVGRAFASCCQLQLEWTEPGWWLGFYLLSIALPETTLLLLHVEPK